MGTEPGREEERLEPVMEWLGSGNDSKGRDEGEWEYLREEEGPGEDESLGLTISRGRN